MEPAFTASGGSTSAFLSAGCGMTGAGGGGISVACASGKRSLGNGAAAFSGGAGCWTSAGIAGCGGERCSQAGQRRTA